MTLRLGSLFDGSGGFPLAATLCGGQAVWASEVEPYPIAVTRSRFPEMIHLGDVSKIRGDQIEPVDVITFGSPCQDLSVAGKRAGLKHTENGDDETTRSGLFMEAVRIIREMRKATNGNYPKYALWENVPGAFSSNKGEDFRIVLEELIKTVEPTAVMPPVPKNGWAYADYFCGDGWSLAWRVLDAQYIRTAQRRRRIYLVLDLRAECAGEILFERESLRGYSAEIGAPWQETARDVGSCAETADRAGNGVSNAVCYGIGGYNSGGMLSSNPHAGIYEAKTSRTLDLNGGNPACNQGGICVVEAVGIDGYNACETGEKAATLGVNCGMSTGRNGVCLIDSIGGQSERGWVGEVAPTLKASHYKFPPSVAVPYIMQAAGFKAGQGENARSIGYEEERTPTLAAQCSGTEPTVCYSIENHPADSRVDIDDSGKVQTLTSHRGTGGGNVPMVMVEKTECLDVGFFNACQECAPSLLAWMYKDPHLVAYPQDAIRYIVRRLTPTECARLQGFPDRWGDIDPKEDFTDEEYRFWLEVRNTHAAINGKTVKDYTKKQMLTWYNKLHTDSAEYKMWGNGIALPCALYVMQGIQEALEAAV